MDAAEHDREQTSSHAPLHDWPVSPFSRHPLLHSKIFSLAPLLSAPGTPQCHSKALSSLSPARQEPGNPHTHRFLRTNHPFRWNTSMWEISSRKRISTRNTTRIGKATQWMRIRYASGHIAPASDPFRPSLFILVARRAGGDRRRGRCDPGLAHLRNLPREMAGFGCRPPLWPHETLGSSRETVRLHTAPYDRQV